MIHQAKPNPQLLDEQIFSERLHPRFLLLDPFRTSDVESEFDRKLRRNSPSGGLSSLSLQRRFMKFP
jgi:hypothetical protein